MPMKIETTRLKVLRIEAGLSLRALAARAGVAHDTVMDTESGRREPHPGTVKKLADALGVSVGDLVDWEAEGIEGKALVAAA